MKDKLKNWQRTKTQQMTSEARKRQTNLKDQITQAVEGFVQLNNQLAAELDRQSIDETDAEPALQARSAAAPAASGPAA